MFKGMERRLFVGALATAAGVGFAAGCYKTLPESAGEEGAVGESGIGVSGNVALAANSTPCSLPALRQTRPVLKPMRLQPGDTICFVAPAGPLRHVKDELKNALHLAEGLGLRCELGKHVTDTYGYLAGSDEARASDFNRFARDPQIRGIFALRGGYGTMRVLNGIDYEALAANPKVVLGFSDLTALLNAIMLQTGLVTFHGPVAAHPVTATAVEGIKRAVMSAEPLGTMRVSGVGSLAHGEAHGRLVGGNLSMIAAMSGTPFAVPCGGNILMLEEVNEAPYRVDRLLTQLRLNGDLGSVTGLALGQFVNCVPKIDDDRPSFTVEEVLRDCLAGLKKPMITRMNVGHIDDQWTLPIGMPVSFDGNAGNFTVAHSAVA